MFECPAVAPRSFRFRSATGEDSSDRICVGDWDPNNPGPQIAAFRRGLRDLGYIEGKNILIEYRYAEGNLDRAPALVAELVQVKVDVLVVTFLAAIRAAKEATKTIPIVMETNQDPVATGIVDSLARPGGNITGLTRLGRELSGKRLELLTEVVPRISRVGVLWDANAPGPIIGFKEYEAAARALKIQIQSLEVRGPKPDLEGAFQVAAKGRTTALITITNPDTQPLHNSDCGPCHKESIGCDVRGKSVRRSWWPHVLFSQRE